MLLVKQDFFPGLHNLSVTQCFDLLCFLGGLYACLTLGFFGLCKYLQIYMQHFVERNRRMVSSSPAVCFLVNLLVLSQWVHVRSKHLGKGLHHTSHKNRNKIEVKSMVFHEIPKK